MYFLATSTQTIGVMNSARVKSGFDGRIKWEEGQQKEKLNGDRASLCASSCPDGGWADTSSLLAQPHRLSESLLKLSKGKVDVLERVTENNQCISILFEAVCGAIRKVGFFAGSGNPWSENDRKLIVIKEKFLTLQ